MRSASAREDVKGFVTRLVHSLRYKLEDEGWLAPDIWRDKTIDEGEEFAPRIVAALNSADIFLVVLSRVWIVRPYCQREAQHFLERFRDEADGGRGRIVVVHKNRVERPRWQPLLGEQEGYALFEVDEDRDEEIDWVEDGLLIKPESWSRQIKRVARHLQEKRRRLRPTGSTQSGRDIPEAAPSGRTVFLALPAGDMEECYGVVARELSNAGYAVVPEPGTDLERDGAAATAQIDAALHNAEVSIHLLGDRLGFAPDGAAALTRLQLERATCQGDRLLRIYWAPRIVPSAASGGRPLAAAKDAAARDPQEVLAHHMGVASAAAFRSGDQLVDYTQTPFVQYVLQHLAASAPVKPTTQSPGPPAPIYLEYQAGTDRPAAIALARGLKHLGRMAQLLPDGGDPAERDKLRSRYLSRCDHVVMCWSRSSEFWVRATADELVDHRAFGRANAFALRVVVQLSPPGSSKADFKALAPHPDIDVVVDATSLDPGDLTVAVSQLAEALRPLLGGMP